MSTPAAFGAGLEAGLKGMGQCESHQQVEGEQFRSQALMSLGDPLAAKIDLALSPSAGRTEVTTLVMLDGTTYAHRGGPGDPWRVVARRPMSAIVHEMDCRSVLGSLGKAMRSVRAGDEGTVQDSPAQRYEVDYDTAAWASAIGDATAPDAATATMVVSVVDGQLAQLEVTTPLARTTEYAWFPGEPDVVAPPADLVAK
ncbi:hypothetical protein H9L10_02235 [Phycicoccus endophyticus]|uniref:LppX_LprAFG lipoprotein n=1 Tax=Phycicoccus endophyticus TaxID=1690220 RepID=A0A7G9R2V1_9MICO|nr:hypothetical protein [Phycicoccus endophyticus]NHI20398.1 hypothetical protein [Phycicoccus endophyticus]QNN49926.1 hypothetical protein H9L10_02235 [Phycicoccus endophyticus]GGL29542.1 hypothetical protein GCM10012283_09880 [Phycicoccus endophyticus]